MKTKRKSKKSIRLIWIILMVLIAILIIVGFINVKNKSKQDYAQETKEDNLQQEEKNEKYVQVLENGTKLNISEKIQETIEVEEFEIYDIQIVYKDGVTNILATIANKTNENLKLQEVLIDLIDDEENIMYTLTGILEDMEANETKQLNTSITADFSNCYDIRITKTK